MGLDMFLTRKIYIGANYEHNNIKGNIEVFRNGRKLNINFNKVTYIEESLFYWRKANQIHDWFVNNVQGGNDDCNEYYVSLDDLEQLISDIEKVLNSPKLAVEILPTSAGFFFGSQEYDEYYIQQLQDTLIFLNEFLESADSDSDSEIYYTASW